MKTSIIIYLIAVFASCQTPKNEKNLIVPIINLKDSLREFNLIDTLDKYIGTDSIFNYDYHRIYIGKTNNTEFAFRSLSDTSFQIYQKIEFKWIITDTINYPISYVPNPTDLNNDSFDDLIITHYITAAGGNRENICFIYTPASKQFVHNEYYDLPNIKYDKKQNLVLSAWWSGVAHCQTKMCYKITGDSLVFLKGIDFCPKEAELNKSAYIEYYTYKNEKRIILMKLKGKQQKMWKIFENAIWNSKDHW